MSFAGFFYVKTSNLVEKKKYSRQAMMLFGERISEIFEVWNTNGKS